MPFINVTGELRGPTNGEGSHTGHLGYPVIISYTQCTRKNLHKWTIKNVSSIPHITVRPKEISRKENTNEKV